MARRYPVLHHIDNNGRITPDVHGAFLRHLRKAMLLALREQGILNAAQYSRAETLLEQQHQKQEQDP